MRCPGNLHASDLPVALDGILLYGSVQTSNAVGFVWTPDSNGRLSFNMYRGNTSANIEFTVLDGYQGAQLHQEIKNGSQITGTGVYQWVYDFVAGNTYHVIWRSLGQYNWVFAGGSYG